jgi:hypothetical protein
MKGLMLLIGAVLAAAGMFVLLHGASYTQDRSVVKIAGFEAKVSEHHAIPPWAGGIALAAGAVLIVVGLAKKR